MTIRQECKYNKRHKIVIGVIVLLCLVLQIFPYLAIFGERPIVDHKECVEVYKLPECASEREFYAYEVSDNQTSLHRIRDYNTCSEYYSNPNYSGTYFTSDIINIVIAIMLLVEILAAIVGVLYGLCKLIMLLINWLTTPEVE